MATLAEIRFDILGKSKGQLLSDDERLEDEYIDKLIRDKRNFMIKDQLKRGLGLHPGYFQDLSCLTIECDTIVCDGVPAGVRYHYVDLPTGVVGRVNYLGAQDGMQQFRETSLSGFVHALPGRFGVSFPLYTILDNRALIKYAPSNMTRLRMIAALDDPMQKFSDCLLARHDEPYPVPVGEVSRLQNLVLQDLLPTRNVQPDTSNNASDETTPADINAKAVQQAQEPQ